MAGTTDSDPLADTAAAEGSDAGARPAINVTATGAAPSEPRAVPPAPGAAPTAIGRYQIEGQLGQGAMGVVFAAHDPDLERRIALKVLRSTDSEAARARLLREARAMARLSHPAVVTVHEVGTAAGVDYVAMELIDGTTLAEWIGQARPPRHDILDAFDTAGRGLAAAHAAGLVHRDFKPHNVLRSRRGRVVVTDFGLARASLDEPEVVAPAPAPRPEPATADTGPGRTTLRGTDAGSLSSTLTATGALLGTPAYMAPEQHDGAGVGPAADQFSYCVALWEALAGERPFPGQTLGSVRAQIQRGPEPASQAKIPRRLRAALRRGLSVDPDARFPTMDALLAAIRKRRRRAWPVFVAAGVVAAAVALFAVSRLRTTAPAALPGCGPAETELATFLRAPERAKLESTADGKLQLASMDALGRDWLEAQRAVCAKPSDPDHARRVTCLRASRGHLETALVAAAAIDPDELFEADPALIAGDPRACTATPVPARVVVEHDDRELQLAIGSLGRKARRDALADPGDGAPCLRVAWLMGRLSNFEEMPHAEATAAIAAASEAADRCGDDRNSASVTLMALSVDMTRLTTDPGQTRRVAALIERAGGDRFLAVIAALIDAAMANFRQDMDTAIAKAAQAADAADALGLRMFGQLCSKLTGTWLYQRAEPGDLDNAVTRLRRALVLSGPSKRTSVQNLLIFVLHTLDRTDEAAAVAAAIDDPDTSVEPGSIAVTGRVVDQAGRPVAGARVVAQRHVVIYPTAFDPTADRRATATTAADGTFTIASAPPRALVMAILGDKVTMPVPVAAKVELTYVATGTVHGVVAVTGTGHGRIEVAVEPLPAPFDAVDFVPPIAADGTWTIDRIPRGKAKVVIATGADQREARFQEIVVGDKPVGPIVFEVAQKGVPIHVVLRSQYQGTISLGIVLVIRGKFTGAVLGDLKQVKAEGGFLQSRAFPASPSVVPEVVRAQFQPGDVLTRVPSTDPGEITVCGLGITGEISDANYMKRIDRHADQLGIACKTTTITGPDQVVLVEVPPMKRLPAE